MQSHPFLLGWRLLQMVKYRIYGYFIVTMILYFIVRFIRILFPEAPSFIRFYLTDVMFVPAMALFGLIFVRFIKNDHTLKISPILLFFQTILIALYFELYLPYYSSRALQYTSDLWDVLMYFVGAIIFLFLQKRL